MAWLYIALYLLLLIPTYILPYFGSNSSLINAVGAAAGMGLSPLWWLHAWCLVMLVILGWWRGKWTAKAWLPVFPVLAGVFDIIPILNMVPLVPTVMHLIAMAVGVISANRTDIDAITGIKRKVAIASGIATLIAIFGVILFISGTFRMADKAKAARTESSVNSKAVESSKTTKPKDAPKPFDRQTETEKLGETAVQKDPASFDAKPTAKEPPENPSETKPQHAESEKPAQAETKAPADNKPVKKVATSKKSIPKPVYAPPKKKESGGSVRYITIQ